MLRDARWCLVGTIPAFCTPCHCEPIHRSTLQKLGECIWAHEAKVGTSQGSVNSQNVLVLRCDLGTWQVERGAEWTAHQEVQAPRRVTKLIGEPDPQVAECGTRQSSTHSQDYHKREQRAKCWSRARCRKLGIHSRRDLDQQDQWQRGNVCEPRHTRAYSVGAGRPAH